MRTRNAACEGKCTWNSASAASWLMNGSANHLLHASADALCSSRSPFAEKKALRRWKAPAFTAATKYSCSTAVCREDV